jgi:hypothetical protein
MWNEATMQFDRNNARILPVRRPERGAVAVFRHEMRLKVKGFPDEEFLMLAFVRSGNKPPEIVPAIAANPKMKQEKKPAEHAPVESGFIPCFNITLVEDGTGRWVEFEFLVYERQTGSYDLFAWNIEREASQKIAEACVFTNALTIEPA